MWAAEVGQGRKWAEHVERGKEMCREGAGQGWRGAEKGQGRSGAVQMGSKGGASIKHGQDREAKEGRGGRGVEQEKEKCREGLGQGWSKGADQGQDRGRCRYRAGVGKGAEQVQSRGAHPHVFVGSLFCILASLHARWAKLT